MAAAACTVCSGTDLDVVHGEVSADEELQSNAATAVVDDDRYDTWRGRLGLRQAQRHLRGQNSVAVDVVLELVDVCVLRQVDSASHCLAIHGRLRVINALSCQLQLAVFHLHNSTIVTT